MNKIIIVTIGLTYDVKKGQNNHDTLRQRMPWCVFSFRGGEVVWVQDSESEGC